MNGSRTPKLVKAVTAGLAAALVSVPLAQAKPAPDARHVNIASLHAVQPVQDKLEMHSRLAQLNLPVPKTATTVVQVNGQHKLAQMHRHLANLSSKGTTTTVTTGFDWSDAGIGAVSALGLVLLAGGGALVTRRRLVGA